MRELRTLHKALPTRRTDGEVFPRKCRTLHGRTGDSEGAEGQLQEIRKEG